MTDGSPPDRANGDFDALERRAAAIAAAAAARQDKPGSGRPGDGRSTRRWATAILLLLAVVATMIGFAVADGDDGAIRYEEPERSTTTTTSEAPSTTDTTTTTTTVPTTIVPPPPTAEPGPISTPPDAVEEPAGALREHVVMAGESFWLIAEQQVEGGGQAEPIARYWSQLVGLNVDRLVEPGNPDLLLPGQVLVLPASAGHP